MPIWDRTAGSTWRRTFRTAWRRGHDIRFLGVLLVISALNDTFIILENFDYLLPFYCTKFSGIPGFLTKAISPVLHLVVGYGFLRCTRWAFFIYLVYAAYGFTNGMVNLACFGPVGSETRSLAPSSSRRCTSSAAGRSCYTNHHAHRPPSLGVGANN